MNFDKFSQLVREYPVINAQLLKLLGIYSHSTRVQLGRWQKNNKVIKLRKNLYLLNPQYRQIKPSRAFLSKEIYGPSYVSLEYALSFYGLIPERVSDVTCVTTKKTAHFENRFGKFFYQHIKPAAFTGFVEQIDELKLKYFIAVPEKAVVDFIYLNKNRFNKDFEAELEESFRFQNADTLDKSKLIRFSELFANDKVKRIVKQVTKL
jgi:hypothetical protein